MQSIGAWIKRHPEFLVLIAVVVVGQVLERVLRASAEQPYGSLEFPVLPTLVLGAMAVLGVVVAWLRVRLGGQLSTAGARLRLPAPESLPARYKVADPAQQAIGGSLALLDIALVLLVAATLRAAAVGIAAHYLSRTWAEVGFVVLVLLVTLLVLARLFRTGGPVLVLLLWSGLDRVVPTAGFVSSGPMPVPTRPRTVTVTPLAEAEPQPTLVTPQSKQVELEPTVVAPQVREGESESTVVAEATVVSVSNGSPDEDATVVANNGEA